MVSTFISVRSTSCARTIHTLVTKSMQTFNIFILWYNHISINTHRHTEPSYYIYMPLCVSITTWVAPFQLSHHRRENNAKKDCHQEKMGEKSSEQNFVIRLRTKLQRMKMMGVSLIAFARKILSLKQDFWCTLHKYNNCTNAHFHNSTNAQLHIHQHSAANIFPQATESIRPKNSQCK